MARRPRVVDKIEQFTSLAEHDAASLKEGQVTVQVFEDRHEVRRIIHRGEAYYSIVDVVGALAEPSNLRRYWSDLKGKLRDEGADELYEKIVQLKLPAPDGKMRATDCANIETLLRVVQSITSPRAEPFKKWLAQVGFERIQEAAEPDKAAQRMVQTYRDLGYSDDWIEQRIRQSMIDRGWSEEVAVRDVSTQAESSIRGQLHKTALGITQKQHREVKGVRTNDDLPDAMNKMELLIDALAKAASSEIMKAQEARGLVAVRDAAMTGAKIAGNARAQIESETGHSIITQDRTMAKPIDRKQIK